jgi:hypothetical protein
LLGLAHRLLIPDAPLLYVSPNDGATWGAVPEVQLSEVGGLASVGQSVWVAGTDRDGEHASLWKSADGGRVWAATPLPDPINLLYRPTDAVGYLAAAGRDPGGAPVFWITSDGGSTWKALPTPRDQGLNRVPSYGSRIEEIARVGDWLVVREYGKVFARATEGGRWRRLPGIDRIATTPNGDQLFVLTDTLTVGIMDRSLRLLWQSSQRIADRADVERLLAFGGAGYVVTGGSEIYQAREGTLRLVRPERRK